MSFRSSTESNGGASAGFDPAPVIPSTVLEGGYGITIVGTTDNAPSIAPTPPSGWALVASGSMPIDGTAAVSPHAVWIYERTGGWSAADETNAGSGTYQWTFAGSEEQYAIMIDADPATFGEFAKNELTGTRTTINAPSVTTTDANELVFHCALKDGGVAFTSTPAGTLFMSNIIGDTGGAGGAYRGVHAEFGIGATGTKAFAHASEESNGYTFSLVPVAAVTREQDSFRFEDDDGTESGSTFLAAQNVDINRAAEKPFRLRQGVQYVGDPPTESVEVQYKENGDAATEWRKVP
jgi:hypothetical protein